MRLSGAALEDHVADVVELLDRHGWVLAQDSDPDVKASPSGARWYDVLVALPGSPQRRATVAMREVWLPVAEDGFERSDYRYELLDPGRNIRRAWHRHDSEWFARRFDVLVHEHCENPIGEAACDHYAGFPVRDAFAGVELLVDAWLDPDPPDCDALRCLESGSPLTRPPEARE